MSDDLQARMDDNEELVCQCECGGNVLGVREFGRLWTWCDRCTPVQVIDVNKLSLRGLEQHDER